MKKIKLAVLASGGGTNLQSIIDNIEAGKLSAEIKVVISNNSKAYALERARKHNIKDIHLLTCISWVGLLKKVMGSSSFFTIENEE